MSTAISKRFCFPNCVPRIRKMLGGEPKDYEKNGSESGATVYEEDTAKRFEIRYKNKIYVRLAYEVFGGSADSIFGIAIGCWNDVANANDILSYNGQTPSFGNPSSFIKVDRGGNVTIGG